MYKIYLRIGQGIVPNEHKTTTPNPVAAEAAFRDLCIRLPEFERAHGLCSVVLTQDQKGLLFVRSNKPDRNDNTGHSWAQDLADLFSPSTP